MENSTDLRLRKIERQLQFYKIGFFLVCILGATLVSGSVIANKKVDIIRAK